MMSAVRNAAAGPGRGLRTAPLLGPAFVAAIAYVDPGNFATNFAAGSEYGYLLLWDGDGVLFDPGEGTQRQMTFAGVTASQITRICVTHFHGDHCLGLPGVLQRISLDEVGHPVHVHFPASGRAYFDRKKAAGKTSMEAMRCLKRRLSDLVYRTMLGDYTASKMTSPGGHRGNDSDSSATGSQPHTGSSEKPLPGPATTQRRTPALARS